MVVSYLLSWNLQKLMLSEIQPESTQCTQDHNAFHKLETKWHKASLRAEDCTLLIGTLEAQQRFSKKYKQYKIHSSTKDLVSKIVLYFYGDKKRHHTEKLLYFLVIIIHNGTLDVIPRGSLRDGTYPNESRAFWKGLSVSKTAGFSESRSSWRWKWLSGYLRKCACAFHHAQIQRSMQTLFFCAWPNNVHLCLPLFLHLHCWTFFVIYPFEAKKKRGKCCFPIDINI